MVFETAALPRRTVVGAERSQVPTQEYRRRQMDGVEGPELGRVERSRDPHDILVEVDKRDPRDDRPCSPDRATADPSRYPFHFDPRHHLDTRSGQDRRSSRRALVSGSGTTSFTMAEESRYRSFPATGYPRSSRSSRRASLLCVVTGPLDGARSRRSPGGGLARPEATSLRRAEADSSTGPSTATGLPRSVTSRRSPRATRRRYRERFCRSSLTPTCFGSMCTHTVASLA